MTLWQLHQKWISRKGEPNVDRIQAAILKELRAARAGKIDTSAALRSEMHGELIACGKIRRGIERAMARVSALTKAAS